MITALNQRWRDRRDSYRPAGEPIRTAEYTVVELRDDSTPRAFVERHHYSGSFPAARWRHGLYRRDQLVGVAVFSVPVNALALRPFTLETGVELGRFVLLDDVPANGETWMLGRCFELLRREGLAGVVSLSDPVARTDIAGRVVFPGHIGTIYQGHNATYDGHARARLLHLLPDGKVFNERALSKIRQLERGWRYAVDQLLEAGAEPFDVADHRGWLKRALAAVTRRLKHSGNHRYIWAVDRRARKLLPAGLPYPKFTARAA